MGYGGIGHIGQVHELVGVSDMVFTVERKIMDKKEVLGKFQRLGKVLMTPVLILPIAGILVGLGSAFTNAALIKAVPWLGSIVPSMFFSLCKVAGNVVMNNIPALFAICVAYGFAKSEKATAALCGFIGYMTMNTVMGTFLTVLGTIDPKNLATGQSSILGIVTLDTGVIGGLLVGALVAWIHNRWYKIELPPVLSIFNGTRFIPAATIVFCSLCGIVMSFIFPPIQSVLSALSDFILGSGALGSFVYGAAERLLLPFGLHHFVYLPFMFTSLGGTATIDGNLVTGAANIYSAIVSSPSADFDIDISRFVMNGKVIFAMFGLTGAALAFYHTALPQNKKKVAALMIAAVIPCFFTGITEPLEYSFLFVAPILFVVHALMAGLAYALAFLLNFNVAGSTAFGGPFLSLIFNGIMGASKGSNWQVILILGPIYFAAYYFLFKFLIIHRNLRTPGREVEEQEPDSAEVSPTGDIAEMIPRIIEAVGGPDNIDSADACFTRLRLVLEDPSLIQEDEVFTKKLGANGVIRVSGGIQIVYGNKASLYATQMRETLGME
ncbi:PTS transporter subunit EIIC [Thermophilibacter immobilis]|nr:PTS transporter subunit EIIC [Thermophilibacter immobilis]